jgi:hypothetical protein
MLGREEVITLQSLALILLFTTSYGCFEKGTLVLSRRRLPAYSTISSLIQIAEESCFLECEGL